MMAKTGKHSFRGMFACFSSFIPFDLQVLTDVVPACEREDRPPKGVDTLFQESHSMHSPDLEDDIGGLIDQVERSDLLSWLRSLTEQQYRVVELYTEGYATGDIAQILSLDKQTVLNHKNRAVQKYKSIIPKVSKG